MKKVSALILMSFLIGGCGVKNYSPVVDNPGPSYQSDLKECRILAEQRMSGAQSGAVGSAIGAGLGAIIGLGVGLIFDAELGGTIAAGALGGGVGGGVSSATQADQAQKAIVVNCLQSRGHNILGY